MTYKVENKWTSPNTVKDRKVIEVTNLVKKYGNKTILNNISFHLEEGEILGILGPNGAGKTTLLETIEGLRCIDEGSIKVLGTDIKRDYKSIQNKLGIQLQKTTLFDKLNVRETLRLFLKLYGINKSIEEVLGFVDLNDKAKTLVKHLSGGQFQRFKLALATLNSPQILFLDEPTTGLDPNARKLLWNMIRNFVKKGTSVILTTHYMEEAETLCDRVAILHKGIFIANGFTQQLIQTLNFKKTIIFDLNTNVDLSEILSDYNFRKVNNQLYVYAENIPATLSGLLSLFSENSLQVNNIHVHQVNLEDVYMNLTESKIVNGDLLNE